MHIKGKHSWLKHLDFILLDLLSLILAFTISLTFHIYGFGLMAAKNLQEVLIAVCMVDVLVILLSNPYSAIFCRSGTEEFLKSVKQTAENILALFALLYITKAGVNYSRPALFVMYVIYFLLSFILKLYWKKALLSHKIGILEKNQKSIFVVGTRQNMSDLLSNISSGFLLQFSVQGICMVDGAPGEKVSAKIALLDEHGEVKKVQLEFENSTTPDGIAQYVLDHRISEVYIGAAPSTIRPEIYQTLIRNGKALHIGIQNLIGYIPEDQFITTVGTFKSLGIGLYNVTADQLLYRGVKRIFDILFGLLGLIGLLPLMLAVKLSYLASGDKGSIFYTQTRVGLNGKPFKMIKFRSMAGNADEMLEELLKDPVYAAEWEENQKFAHDPRITKMGNLLRKTSMDEVPQFLNVLKGDMSLIGPRPLVIGELESHNGLQLYNQVKPGITGWWGCNGRSNTTYAERLDLEYYYVKNCSFYLDVLTIIKTIVVLVSRSGAK